MFAPLFGPICLWFIYRDPLRQAHDRSIWPTLLAWALAVPATYGLGLVFMHIMLAIPGLEITRDRFGTYAALAMASGALSAVAAHLAAVIRRRRRAGPDQK